MGLRYAAAVTLSLGAAAAAIFDIARDCGAVADNQTLNSAAISACVSRAQAGDTLLVPAGVFLTGKVSLRAGQTLRFAAGGWLQGSPNAADYGSDWDFWHVVELVAAPGAAVVADERGAGGIVGAMWQMVAGWDASQRMWTPAPWTGVAGCVGECRPKNLAVIDSPGVVLRDFALRDSSDWSLLLRRSSNLVVDGLVIRGSQAWGNGDGIDIESGENISLANLDIATGDDCIAMRSGNCNDMRTPWPRPLPPLRDVRIRNCTLSSNSAAIKIENLFQADHGNVSGIVVDGVTIYDSNRGVGIWQRVAGPSGGWMGDIVVRNARIETRFAFGTAWWGSGEAIVVTSVPENAAQAAVGLPGIHGVLFENIVATAEGGCLFSSRGQLATSPRAIDGLVLRNVSLTVARTGTGPIHAQFDFRPVDSGGGAPNTLPANVTGLVFENVDGATVEGASAVAFVGPEQPYWAGDGHGACVSATPNSHVDVDSSFVCTTD